MHSKQEDCETIVNWLSASSVFQGMLVEDLNLIAERIEVRTFLGNEKLAAAGEEVKEFWIIVEGFIEAILEDFQGHERLLGVVGPGESIGEVSLIEKTQRPVRFIAQSSGTLIALSAADFYHSIELHPVLMRNLFRRLSTRFKQVVGVLRRELPSRRLAIFAGSPKALILAGRLVSRLRSVGERLHIRTNHKESFRESDIWPESQAFDEIQVNEPIHTQPNLPNVDRQIAIFIPPPGSEADFSQLQNCDEILWLLEPQATEAAFTHLRHAAGQNERLKHQLRVVWVLGEEAPVAPVITEPEFTKTNIKLHVETTGSQLTRLESQGLDRLERALRGYSVGIALAGGGAKGMAHFGVLRVLEDAGLSFDTMSGTSAGAMAGVLYASGMPPKIAIENFLRDLTPSRSFRMLPGWPNLYLLTQFRRGAWEAMLRKYLRDWRLEQLSIPFAAMTVDLVQGRSVVRRTGDAVHAILESINLPVISRPILRDGMMLVDGGMLDNLPAGVLSSGGADFVIGVDVSRRMRHEFAGNRPDTPASKMKNAGTLDTLFRIFEAQAHNLGAIRSRAVDFWITPDTSSFALADFYRSDEIFAAGEASAQSILPALQKRLSDMTKRLFDPAT